MIPWVIKSFLTLDSMDRTLKFDHWKAVEQYFTVVLFVFRFYSVCNLRKIFNFGHSAVRSERVKSQLIFRTPFLELIVSFQLTGHATKAIKAWSPNFEPTASSHLISVPVPR